MSHEERIADLVVCWEEAWEHGRDLPAEELCADAPELIGEVKAKIEALKQMQWVKPVLTRQFDDTDEEPQSTDLPLPYVIGGRYRCETLIAEGGFGKVYRGYDPELDRPVAIKIPRLGRACSTRQADALLEEARRVARLRHPRIVAVHDVGRDDGVCFIVSDLIEGRSFIDLLAERRPSAQEAVRIVAAVADALHFAHEQGFLHRDVKPANILLDKAGHPHVTDFGIATTKADLEKGHGATAGTLAYMAPEQVAGEIQLIDARTDIYSLGVVLYESLAGKLPYPARTPTALREQILFRPPLPPTEQGANVAKELERLCLRCLSKHPADRPGTAKELAEALRSVRVTPPLQLTRRLVFPLIFVGGAGIAVATAAAWRTLQRDHAAQTSEAMGEERVLHFDGQSRIITPVERFAPVTLEAWVRPSMYRERGNQFIIGSDIPTRWGICLGISGAVLSANYLEGQFFSDRAVPLNEWSHVAGVFAETETRLYLNGELVATGPATRNEGGTPFVIGSAGEQNPIEKFTGQMRAVRISRGERYSADFTPTDLGPDETAGLVYDGSHSDGDRIPDLSGNGSHGRWER